MYLDSKHFWVNRYGQVFPEAKDVKNKHLLNIINFLSRQVLALETTLKGADDDIKQMFEGRLEKFRQKTYQMIDEAGKRGLLKEEEPLDDSAVLNGLKGY